MLVRLAKIGLTAASTFFLSLVVFNNLTDYGSNFAFVHHVLAMDTTFPGNRGMWRALEAPWIHHAFYATIIAWEAASAAIIGIGAIRLWTHRRASADAWQHAKSLATAGLVLSLLQWYVAFIAVGGEWFLMWQSKIWNGQDAALRMFAMVALSVIFLQLRDQDLPATAS
jgi:predicted small integral membrane protein